MSTLFVANVAFLANDNSQITYSNNTVSITAGGNAAFIANSTVITIPNPPTSIGGGTTVANDTLTYTSNQSATSLTTNGQVIISGNVSPTMLSASTADWNPLFGNAYFVKVSSNTALSIYGMVEGTNGQIVVLNNIGNSAITLTNEDAANENTATRRFQLPNNITVYPFSSISLIYDGISSRWKAQNSIGTNFFHKVALTKGFFSGGNIPAAATSVSERITYSSETNATVAGSSLSIARVSLGAAGNACKAFFYGGTLSPAIYSTADRTTYSTETNAAVAGAVLNQGRSSAIGSGNSCKGFFNGGFTPTLVSTAERTTYSTEISATVSGINLSQVRSFVSSVGNVCKGFTSGGSNPAPVFTIYSTTDRTSYSTETNATVAGAALSLARYNSTALGNSCKGFFSGGITPTPAVTIYSTTDRITYATETNAAVPGANLSGARSNLTAAGNACKGFFAGGSNPALLSTADRITYATETNAAVPGANLGVARNSFAGA